MTRYLRWPAIREITGASPSTVWRWEKSFRFPHRKKLGPNSVGWKSDELAAWAADPERWAVEHAA